MSENGNPYIGMRGTLIKVAFSSKVKLVRQDKTMAYIDEEDSRLVLVYMTSNPNATIYAWVTYVNTSYFWHNDMAATGLLEWDY